MDPRLTVEHVIVRRHEPERWNVRYEGRLIGYVIHKQVGSRPVWFYDAHVLIDGHDVSLDLDTDFDGRCNKILTAFLDPAAFPQTRYWLRL
ncbi:hypothetical protein K8F61_18530 [Microbacterium resistens]|uniref:Uncharacterized protein n=1 Tax=Microbacterium resistens TaxID=156977 RepID=A0ABY3RRA5_9MICO|nr:hypothetical protein [Microbacterium resistens]UGS26582.1 hypothetical protein K8F61_18530 [Microbacterium resistens]